MSSLRGCLLLMTLTMAAQADWRSPEGPDGVTRIVVEAEEMRGLAPGLFGGTGPEWRLGRFGYDFYQHNVFGGHWQSRNRTAMTDKGGNAAELVSEITVPSNGTYKLWAKYECPPFFNYAFDVALRGADGKEVFRKTYGLEAATKHYSFNKEPLAGSLYWTWGIDHDAAEGYEVSLPKGTYTLVVAKTANPEPAGMRSLDVLMLTSDLSPISSPRYNRFPLLDELRRANHVFLRFRLPPGAAEGPVLLTWDRWGKRYPDFYTPTHTELVRAYDREGRMLATNEAVLRKGQLPGPLQAGETSLWLDIGPCLNVENAATFQCTAGVFDPLKKKASTNQPASIAFAVDVALEPSEAAILLTFSNRTEQTGRTLTFLLQPDLKYKDGVEASRTLAETYAGMTARLNTEPRQARGLPRKMRFYGNTGGILGRSEGQPWAWKAGLDFRHALGLNTLQGSAVGLTPQDFAREKAYYKERGDELMWSASHHHSQDPAKIASNVLATGTAREFYYLSYGDEIGLPAIDVKKPEVVEAFKAYLKEQGVTPATLGLPDWEVVKPLNSLSAEVAVQIGVIPAERGAAGVDSTLKRLYWHSAQFRIKKGIEDFAEKTRLFREKLGPQVHTSANLGGMHPFYWMHQSSFIEAFKHKAMTMAWTEDYDYCQPEASRLVAEFQAGYLKCGAKYHGNRMMFYCMPHYPGNSPEHLLQNCVLEWGQNVKDIDWFSIQPDGFTTENYISTRFGGEAMFGMLRRASDMAAVTEKWLEPAKPVDAAVALLLSEASDTWEIGGKSQGAVKPGSEETNAFQEERKNTYYALRHAGYRVDLITEADVREGWLDRYKALYIGGENLERATAPAIVKWVEKGGVLVASAGTARKDEYDEPFTGLDAVLGRGARDSYERYKGPLRSKLELLFLKPLDTVSGPRGATCPAYAVREFFAPAAGAEVLGRYAKDAPAWVRAQTGKGTGWYIGTFPATAWLKPALPLMPCGKGGPETAADGSPRYPQFEPVDFDAAAGSFVLRPLETAGLRPDVRIDRKGIAANRLAGPAGTVLTLVNLARQQKGAAADVTVTVEGLGRARRVWSYAFPKGLENKAGPEGLAIRLPAVDLADVVVIEK